MICTVHPNFMRSNPGLQKNKLFWSPLIVLLASLFKCFVREIWVYPNLSLHFSPLKKACKQLNKVKVCCELKYGRITGPIWKTIFYGGFDSRSNYLLVRSSHFMLDCLKCMCTYHVQAYIGTCMYLRVFILFGICTYHL